MRTRDSWVGVVSRVMTLACAVVLLGATSAQAAPSDLDSSFGNGGTQLVQPFGTVGGGTPNCCRAAMYPGGKFVVLSQFYNSPTVAISRYTSAGTLDTSFNAHGPIPGVATVTFGGAADNGFQGAVAVDAHGRVVVATTVANSGAFNAGIARLTPGGALDTSFNGTGIEETALGFSEAQTTAITLLPDDRIVVGALVITSGSQRELIAARFGTDGTRDGAFGAPFAPASGTPAAPLIAQDGQGRFLLAGDVNGSFGTQQLIARLDASGHLDPTFGGSGNPAGTVVTSFAPSASVLALDATTEGRPVLAGLQFFTGTGQPVVERFTTAGSLDPTFAAAASTPGVATLPGRASGALNAIARQSDGSWVVGGTSNGTFAVGRFTPDGAPDASFAPSASVSTAIPGSNGSSVTSLTLDGSGRILAVGDGYVGSITEVAMARYQGTQPTTPSGGAPTVSGETLLAAGPTSATVGANVNPNGSATSYHVEWGPTASYGSQGPSLPASGPLTGGADQSVAAQMSGLAPQSTYHWRIVARSAAGATDGPDQILTTSAPAPSPSPPAPPTAIVKDLTPPVIGSGTRGEFSAAGSIVGSSPIVQWSWDWNSDGHYDSTCPGADPVAVHDFIIPGTYVVGLLATAGNGQTSSSSTTVSVSHVPGATTHSPTGAVSSVSCGSLIHDALCVHHVEWDLIVADALDNGCFEQRPVVPNPPTTRCVVCSADAAATPAIGVPPALSDQLHKLHAQVWAASGRVLVNGMIIAPRPHPIAGGAQQTAVVIDELDDVVYSGVADTALKAPAAGGLPDTPLARGEEIYARLPASAPPPPLGALDTARAVPASRSAPTVHADGDGGFVNPCEDPQIKNSPTFANFPQPAQAGLASDVSGFPLSGPVTVHVVNDRVIVCVDVELPSLLPCPGDGRGKFVLKATLLADQSGLELQNLRARLPCATIAGVVFSDVGFDYQSAGHQWEAQGTVEAIPGLPLTGDVTFDQGNFVSATLSLENSAIAVPPVQVTKVEVGVYPDKTTGQVDLGLVPVIPVVNKSLLDISGRYTLNWGANPPYFELDGDASSLGFGPFASAWLKVQRDSLMFHTHFGGDLFGISAQADVDGALWSVDPLRFNVEGDGTLSIFDLINIGGSLLISDNGAAGCVAIVRDAGPFHLHLHIGVAVNWSPFRIDPMFTGCDVGVERDAGAPARDARAHAAQAGFRVPVAGGTQYEIIGAEGAGAPPAVELDGPGGARVAATASGPILNAQYAVVHDAARNTTYVIVRSPAAGTWSVKPVAGSPGITAVHFATSLPPVGVKASVTGSGLHRRLSYAVRRIPGQVVRFVERGPNSLALIGTVADGGRGVIRFHSGAGPAGRREVVALVQENSHPRAQMVVAAYTAPAPARLTRPSGLRAVRRHGSLTFSWRRVAGAGAYAIVIRTSDHRSFVMTLARRSFMVLAVAARTTARITVRALDEHGRGPAASLQVHPLRRR